MAAALCKRDEPLGDEGWQRLDAVRASPIREYGTRFMIGKMSAADEPICNELQS
jgi:hypothetical protein